MPLRRTHPPQAGEAGYGNPRHRRTVYVVFQESDARPWWRFWTSAGYRHVWAFAPVYYPEEGLLATRYAVKFEPLAWGIDWTQVWFEDPDAIAQAFYRAGVHAIIKTTVDFPPRGRPPFVRGLITCVSMMKTAMGITAPTIWTPKQLCVYMLRHGGELVEREGGDEQGC